ncbi:hypothetical protein WM43_03930 [Aeromonas veronii]|uniref:Uncharacterized protein n=1 Tax=Aeromonas veronii TaxID=654 RepID=A0AAC9FKP3_AERVE|nr:hypothetical protein WM43_03930 [Aeromonas veronii]
MSEKRQSIAKIIESTRESQTKQQEAQESILPQLILIIESQKSIKTEIGALKRSYDNQQVQVNQITVLAGKTIDAIERLERVVVGSPEVTRGAMDLILSGAESRIKKTVLRSAKLIREAQPKKYRSWPIYLIALLLQLTTLLIVLQPMLQKLIS